MAPTIPGTQLVDPAVIDEPYGFYEDLRAGAPVWEVPGTGIFAVASFQLLAEAAGRVDDFSSNLNCDPAVFDHPETIDLTRQVPRRHVAFGRGIHHCVGASLARVEAKSVLGVLLGRTRDITLDPQRPPKWANNLMVRRHEELHVRLAAY